MTHAVPVRDAAPGEVLTLLAVPGGPEIRTRLSALGLRPGRQLHVVGKTSGGGRILAVDGARIAVDHATAAGLLVLPTSQRASATT